SVNGRGEQQAACNTQRGSLPFMLLVAFCLLLDWAWRISLMQPHTIDPMEPVANRPGRRARSLAGSEHGFDSLFINETEMDAGSAIPLHTHPIEEAWVVTDGELVVRVAEEEVTVASGQVIRVPPNVPHAVRNAGPD